VKQESKQRVFDLQVQTQIGPTAVVHLVLFLIVIICFFFFFSILVHLVTTAAGASSNAAAAANSQCAQRAVEIGARFDQCACARARDGGQWRMRRR
jgi:hypothetical protein